MPEVLHPGLLLMVGALPIPVLKGAVRSAYLVMVPFGLLALLVSLPEGEWLRLTFLDYTLTLLRVDRLSIGFAMAFVIALGAGMLYGLPQRDWREHLLAYLYAGSTLGVTFAGDLVSLFVFWEMMALFATLLIWSARRADSYRAGLRYLIYHLIGGLFLLFGILGHWAGGGGIEFNALTLESVWAWCILIAFVINAGVPPFHSWLPDAYPTASVSGIVYLGAFTTKASVYVLARGFAGAEVLMWAGAVMALYGVVYATFQNDMRRLLSYHIVSQVGYMVCAVGIGGTQGVNGATAHAFAHIMYKSLLLMGAGAVLFATGKERLSDLSGAELYRRLPVSLMLYLIGALSISGVPLFNGFVSKAIITEGLESPAQKGVYLMLTVASVGTFLSVALKLAYFAWFGTSKPERVEAYRSVQEVPLSMQLGMGVLAFICIAMGVVPALFNAILPYPEPLAVYAFDKVLTTVNLFVGTGLGFMLLVARLEPKPKEVLDLDWFYRRGLYPLVRWAVPMVGRASRRAGRLTFARALAYIRDWLEARSAGSFSVSDAIVWIALFLLLYVGAYLIVR
ncbi:MAG: Na(+)/H(+) antiporter subunit D [Fimbriimonadales bacterium]